MQAYQPTLFTRDDTFFGVCEALGEDFGFHPNLLRLPLGVALLWNPAVILSLYFGAGILVFLVLYFRAYWMDQRRVVSYLLAIAGLGAGFSAINVGGTVYFVFAAGFLGRVGTVRRGVQLLVILVVSAVLRSP